MNKWHGAGACSAIVLAGVAAQASCGGASNDAGGGAGGATSSTTTSSSSSTTTSSSGAGGNAASSSSSGAGGNAASSSSSGAGGSTGAGGGGALPAGWLYTNGNKIYAADGKGSGAPWMGRGVNVDDIFFCGYNNTLWMPSPETTARDDGHGPRQRSGSPTFVRMSLGHGQLFQGGELARQRRRSTRRR